MMIKTKKVIVFAVILIIAGCKSGTGSFDKKQIEADVSEVMKRYRTAWENGDSETVMSVLSSDIKMYLPGESAKPIKGKEALANYWFPDSDISYPILEYDITDAEILPSDELTSYQGISRLTWYTLENGVPRDTVSSISEFTTLLSKEDGEWKIRSMMFTLKANNYSR